jgi:hypothetical protein
MDESGAAARIAPSLPAARLAGAVALAEITQRERNWYTTGSLTIRAKQTDSPIGDAAVEKVSLPFFYELGAVLSPLAQMNPDTATKVQVFVAAIRLKSQLGFLLQTFSTLTVCRAAALELLKAFEDVEQWFRTAGAEQLKEALGPTDFKFRHVIAKAKQCETVLSAELQTLATYHATQKGIYSTPDLIERAENVFPDTIRDRLTPETVEEIRQSGRCLAFDSATACGFHIMRATETVLHEYYVAVCKPKPKPKKRLESWGAYLAKLKLVTDPDVQEVVAILQQTKDHHRNLIMHPEAVLTPDEAFVLFEVAQGAIIAMASRLPGPTKKGSAQKEGG